MNVAYQGEPGAFSEQSALSFFGAETPTHLLPKPSFEAVFAALECGEADFIVIPIENSLYGSVHVNYDHLRKHDFTIVGELKLRVVQNLLAPTGTTFASIQRVYSHWQALGQSQAFLRQNLPHAQLVDAYDTAGAAKMVASGAYPHSAAVASKRAALHYGLEILAESIETDHQNFTRFLVLSRHQTPAPLAVTKETRHKTSIVFAHKENIAGALFKSLAVFALRDIDLLKIESRPLVGSPWAYLFYLDFVGSLIEERVLKALDHLSEIAGELKVLGTYPEGATIWDA